MNFIIFLISLQLDSDIHINLYYLFQILLMSNSANIMLRNPSSLLLIPQRDMDPNLSHISNYFDQQVPILSISKNLGKISLIQKEDGKSKKTSNDNYLQDTVAFGTLYGIDEVGISVRYEGIFQANFLGMMQIQPIQELDEHTVRNVYFQGKISNIQNKIALITPQTSQNMHNQQQQPSQIYLLLSSKDRMKVDQQLKYPEESCFQNLKTFRGFFNGSFHNIPKINELSLQDFKKCQEIVDIISKDKGINLSQSFFNQDNKKNKPKKQAKSYYVPALVTFQLGKLIQINRQKSSVDISASLNIIIRLNQDIVDRIKNDQQQYQNQQYSKLTYKQRQKIQKQDIKKLYKFTIQFHRGRVITLPFYNIDQQPQQLIQDEWADPLQGIDVVSQWDEQQMIMKYKITTIFRAQIDNGFGIFYSPFNLNVMKIVITLHSLKIGNTSIHINCCDLSDSQHGNDYKPYTFFNDLQINKQAQKDNMVQQMFAKHIERRSKINIDNFIDEGEYKLADNRMTLFPYHKRKFDNQVNRANKYSWMFGVAQRSSLLQYPIIKGLKQRYQQAIATKKIHYSKFQIPEWMFVHVQIPIFRYPVIDLIRIFVPILILSTISLLIFVQENATDGNGFTTLAKRIASGCSLMIAYVALVPMIRSNLPPTPSVTLIQILIYVSTIPNFLAIISNLITDFIDFNDFFTNYTPFSDGLFLVSFLISVVSFIILLILAVIFSRKMYKSPFILNKTKPLSTDRARNPIFMKMVEDISKNIKEYRISFCK